MDVPALLLAFRRSVWFRVFYLVILGLVAAALFRPLTGPLFCLIFLLVPITMFVIPYWLGERETRNVLLNGLVIFLVAILVTGAGEAQATIASAPILLDSAQVDGSPVGLRLLNGTVEPYPGTGPGNYTYRVEVRTLANDTPSNHTVYLEYLTVSGLAFLNKSVEMSAVPGVNNTRDGVIYEVNRSVDAVIHGYGFWVRNATGNLSATPVLLGPITAGWLDYFVLWLSFAASVFLFPLLFYYMFVFMWWYSRRMRTGRARMVEDLRASAGAKASSKGESGKAGKAAAFTCTACGADVDDTDEKCPKCGAVFED